MMTSSITSILVSIDSFLCDALRDLVPFEQFKKREKHLWGSFTFRKAYNATKTSFPPWVFFTFFELYK